MLPTRPQRPLIGRPLWASMTLSCHRNVSAQPCEAHSVSTWMCSPTLAISWSKNTLNTWLLWSITQMAGVGHLLKDMLAEGCARR